MNEAALKNRRVALIGGAGFIGHNLALKLKRAGADVHVIDSLQVNNLGAFSNSKGDPNKDLYVELVHERLAALRAANIPLHIVDARDYHVLSRSLAHEIDAQVVVQLAAIAHANRSNKDPYSTFDHSLRTLENALDASRDRDVHFIYFSSSMVYGDFDGEAVTEDRHCNPLGIYGALKYSGEKLVIAHNQVFKMPYTIIRPSALYGERCVSRRVGQAFIENALRGRSLTINGDGNDGLDFTYIEDLAQGIMRCMVRPEARNQIFNLTFGGARSINQLAEIVRKEFPGIEIEYKPRDALMPERGTLSIEKAKRLLGYAPENPLEVGFPKYIRWYKDVASQHPELFRT
jgi:nucleoside-diphosphate-sugar epimerase